jgi:hypothetical protein
MTPDDTQPTSTIPAPDTHPVSRRGIVVHIPFLSAVPPEVLDDPQALRGLADLVATTIREGFGKAQADTEDHLFDVDAISANPMEWEGTP